MGRPVVNPYPFHGWNLRTQVVVAVMYGIATAVLLCVAIAKLIVGSEKPLEIFDVVMFFIIAGVTPIIGTWVIIRGRRPRPGAADGPSSHNV